MRIHLRGPGPHYKAGRSLQVGIFGMFPGGSILGGDPKLRTGQVDLPLLDLLVCVVADPAIYLIKSELHHTAL